MSRERDNKSFQERIKHFFRMRTAQGSLRDEPGLSVSGDLERELGRDAPNPQRLRSLRELVEKVRTHQLADQESVERLWSTVADLVQPEQPRECRHAALAFLHNLVQGQFDMLNMMRAHFFRVVRDHAHPEDAHQRLCILQALTNNGKDITYFEEEIFNFMLHWMPALYPLDLVRDFLALLVNLIKYNAAYMSKDTISGFVNNTCVLCCQCNALPVGLGCLQVLDAIVCYSIFPHESLQIFISALCRTVNVEHYCQTSWKIMRSMLGTDLGHAALLVMCTAMGASAVTDCHLTRGAVFHINMALWSSKRVTALKCAPTQVLPSFLKALDGNQPMVTFEVIVAMQSLVTKHGKELHEPAWDLIFTIISTVIRQMEDTNWNCASIASYLHETITAIEQLHENGQFNGSSENMYSLIDLCGHSRTDASVFRLINYYTSQVIPTNYEWLTILNKLVERYCRQDTRVNIRLKVLQNLQTIYDQNRHTNEEELLDKVVLPNLLHCHQEQDPIIRCAYAKLLIDIAMHCQSKRFSDLFDILEKILNRPFESHNPTDSKMLSSEMDVSDIMTVSAGVISIFLHKLHKLPSSHAVRAYLTVLNHLCQHYTKPTFFEHHPNIRLKLLEWFLSARANASFHIGFPMEKGGRVYYSPYLCIEGGDAFSRPFHSPTPVTVASQVSYVSIRKACNIIITCLKQEKDWSVLQVILKEIPNILQNKALVLSKNSNDVDLLASALCAMVADKSLMLPESLYNTPGKLTQSDFHAVVLPVFTCLAPYHTHLDPQLQQRIIRSIVKFGLVISRCAQQCITALTIFTLEMRDTMVRLLPDVLLDLSKISATVHIAVPILEFLSTLTRLPKVFASFVDDQYMSVFAILLPYTNPFKYNHYIVSLAHHVIAAWFLKCRLPFRRGFVKFIKHGLHNNILKPFEEGKFKQDFPELNQDSSSRKRSSSLTEQGSRRREIAARPTLGELRTPQEASYTFHTELTETCIDLMARYTYSQCISIPRRLPAAEFLLSGGQSMTWLLGHKIITVTTSGCSQNTLRHGLCERCSMLCKAHVDSIQSPYTNSVTTDECLSTGVNDIKRYSKYTLQHSKSNETTNSSSSISDNILFPPSCHNTLSLQSLSGHTTRQNSSENKNENTSDSPKGTSENDVVTTSQLNFKLENLEKKSLSSIKLENVCGLSQKGTNGSYNSTNFENRLQCGCWCGGWAEIHVRSPTGDVSWVTRLQNQVHLDMFQSDLPLSDISSLFLPSLTSCGILSGNLGNLPNQLGSAASIASSGFADVKSDILSDEDPRSRSGSGGSQPDHIQKSNSDSVVASANIIIGSTGLPMTHTEPKVPHASTYFIIPPTQTSTSSTTTPALNSCNRSHISTGPINIPGSPQRQNSSGTNTDDEDPQVNVNDPPNILDENGKSRHPVRRSNSSPEMSSSWKNPFHVREKLDAVEAETNSNNIENDDNSTHGPIINDYQCDISNHKGDEISNMPPLKKSSIKSLTKDMRVSCEAIPEEMSSNTPPQAHNPLNTHPHLMTYNSDPGSVAPGISIAPHVSSTSEKNILSLSTNQNEAMMKLNDNNNLKSAKSSDVPISNPPKSIILPNEKFASNDFLKLSSKPPHSPAPASPRPTNRLQNLSASRNLTSNITATSKNASDSIKSNKLNEPQMIQNLTEDDLPPLSRSKRSKTISVMSPTRKRRDNSSKSKESTSRSGVSPAFVFLQLYLGSGAGNNTESPLLLTGDQHARSVKNFDLIPPLETYRIGVLYVGRGQHDNETKILKNEFGSLRYAEFLQDLGTLISLEDAESMGLYLNVEKGGRDGRFAYVWQDDIMQVHFHVATLMPNNSSDPECNEKRKHIGNDYVSIIYNESGEDFLIQTIKGHFNFACIIIEPLDHGTNRVTIKTKDELIERDFLNQTDPKIISDQNVALLARQLALHANLASLISRSLTTPSAMPYASNWLERLRAIKRLRNKLLQEKKTVSDPSTYQTPASSETRRSPMEDFTEYT